MKEIKIVFMDLDGTLLYDFKDISDYTKDVIDRVIDKGITFVPCTGRAVLQMPEWLVQHEGIKYIAGANGARLAINHGKDILVDFKIDNDDVTYILDALKEYDHYITLVIDGFYYSLEKSKEVRHLFPADHMYHVENVRKYRDSFENVLDRDTGVEKIHFAFPTSDLKKEALKKLESLEDLSKYNYTTSHPKNIEISSNEATKGNIVRYLTEYLGYSADNVLACGDNYNDISMLEYAAYKVAMKNAEQEVLDIATHITDDYQNDGAAKMLETLILNKE